MALPQDSQKGYLSLNFALSLSLLLNIVLAVLILVLGVRALSAVQRKMQDAMVLSMLYIVMLLGILLFEYEHQIFWMFQLLVLSFTGQVFMIGMVVRQVQSMQLPKITETLLGFEKLLLLWTLALGIGGAYKGTDCSKDQPYPEAFFLVLASHGFLYFYALLLVTKDFYIYPLISDTESSELREALLSHMDYDENDEFKTILERSVTYSY